MTSTRRSFFAKLIGLAAAPVLVKCEMPTPEPPHRVMWPTGTRLHVTASGNPNALIVRDPPVYFVAGKGFTYKP